MVSDEQLALMRPKLATARIIAAALIVGVLIFTGLLFVIVDWEKLGEPLKLLTLIGAVTGVALFAMSIFAPGLFAGGATIGTKDATDSEKEVKSLANSFVVETLIRYFLIEGAIFLNLMVFMLEPHKASLIVVAIGVLLMLVSYPRQSALIARVENHLG